MGLFGGGNSKNTSNNYDNRVINDLGGSSFKTDKSNNGQFAGVKGNINFNSTDGGAFNVVNAANSSLADVSNNALQLGYELGNAGLNAGNHAIDTSLQVAKNSQDFALSAINQNSNLVVQYGDLSTTMLSNTLASVDNTMNNTAQLLDSSNSRTLDAALNITKTGLQQTQLNNQFAKDLTAQNSNAALQQQQNNNKSLNNGFKSMMQFADSFSRSDGANIAKNNNKTMMFFVGSAVVSLFILKQLG